MKTAEEVLKEQRQLVEVPIEGNWYNESRVLCAMKSYAESALREAAERAAVKWHSYPEGYNYDRIVDKDSILSLISELK